MHSAYRQARALLDGVSRLIEHRGGQNSQTDSDVYRSETFRWGLDWLDRTIALPPRWILRRV